MWSQPVSTTPALSQVNESWTLSDCTVARCEGHNQVALLGRKPVASIHCVNGHPPVRVSQESEPCDFHFECECKRGQAEGQWGTRREPEPRPTVPAREGDTPVTAGGRPRFAEPTGTAACAAGRGPWVRGLLSQGIPERPSESCPLAWPRMAWCQVPGGSTRHTQGSEHQQRPALSLWRPRGGPSYHFSLGGSGCPGAGGHEPPATASSSHGRSPPARTFIIELGPPGSPGWCHLEVLNSVTDMKPFSQIRARSQGLGGHGDLPLGTACNPLHPFYKKGSRGPGQPGWRCRVALGEGRGAPQAPAAAGGARTTPPSTAPPTPSWTPAPTCS